MRRDEKIKDTGGFWNRILIKFGMQQQQMQMKFKRLAVGKGKKCSGGKSLGLLGYNLEAWRMEETGARFGKS